MSLLPPTVRWLLAVLAAVLIGAAAFAIASANEASYARVPSTFLLTGTGDNGAALGSSHGQRGTAAATRRASLLPSALVAAAGRSAIASSWWRATYSYDTATDTFAAKATPAERSWIPTREELLNAAQAPDRNGFTAAGRAYQKHSGRPGGVLPKLGESPKKLNPAGLRATEEILDTPGLTIETNYNARVGYHFDLFVPGGRGVRYRTDGSFAGFLEPKR